MWWGNMPGAVPGPGRNSRVPDLRVGTAPIWRVGGAEGLSLKRPRSLGLEENSRWRRPHRSSRRFRLGVSAGLLGAAGTASPAPAAVTYSPAGEKERTCTEKGGVQSRGAGGGRGHTVVRSDRVLWGGQWEGELLQRQGRRHQRTPPHHAP